MKQIIISAVLALAILAAACGVGGSGEDGQSESVNQEVAAMMEGLTKAFFNGKVSKVLTYLSVECTDEQREEVAGAVLFAAFAGGAAEVTVNPDLLQVYVVDADHVVVSAVQPDGAVVLTVDGRPIPSEDVAYDEPLKLVRESGVWVVEDCAGFAMAGESDEVTPTTELREYGFGEAISVDAADLPVLVGQENLEGETQITFLEVEFVDGIEDQFTGRGTIRPLGRFVIVFYAVNNDLNVEIQPATQIGDEFILMDDRDRQWETVDYTGNYGGVSGSAAVARGFAQPETMVPPGFERTTAVVYDVPLDANELALVWAELGIRVFLPLK